jgi:hypothetical protein
VTARGPDPDRFVDCRRLVLGVDMAEIPGRRSFDETGPLSEEATNKRCLLRQTSQTPRGLDKMWVARAVVLQQSSNLNFLHWQTSLSASFDVQRDFPALANLAVRS